MRMKQKLFSILALLLMAATGAWAQEPATTYKVTLQEGTEDAENWTVPAEAAEGSPVTATYKGEKKVKSVKAVKKGGAVDNTYLRWNRMHKKLVEEEIPAGATVVTSSTTTWTAGTYVVEGQVTITGTITLDTSVKLIIKDGAKLTVGRIDGGNKKLYIYGQSKMNGELVVNCTNGDAIFDLTTLEVHSAKVTATSSYDNSGGFLNIGEFNVYGGLVDAKTTAAKGYGIYLKEIGNMNIYGGEVKAEGKGSGVDSYGITSSAFTSSDAAYVRVYGGKLWAGNANNSALNHDGIYLTKDNGYTSGKIEYSSDNNNWSEEVDANAKYVRVGY